MAADQYVVGIRDLALAAADSHVTSAQGQLGAASKSLQSFAVNEYISSGLYSGAPLVSNAGSQPLSPSTPQDTDGVVVQQYLGVTANSLVAHDDTAAGAYKAAEQRRGAASKALARAAVALTSDESAENRDLTQLITDVGTLEHAGACATVTITPPPSSGSAAGRHDDHHHHDDGPADDDDHDSPRPPPRRRSRRRQRQPRRPCRRPSPWARSPPPRRRPPSPRRRPPPRRPPRSRRPRRQRRSRLQPRRPSVPRHPPRRPASRRCRAASPPSLPPPAAPDAAGRAGRGAPSAGRVKSRWRR